MKKTFLIIGLNLSLVMVLVVFPSVFIRSRQGNSNTNGNQQFSFTTNRPLTFYFNSNFSDLQSIFIDMKNPNIDNNSKIYVKISGPTDSRQLTFSGSNVGDPATVPLKFLPFTDPPLTKYQVSLTTENTKSENLFIITNQNNLPVFKTFYQQTNFKSNLMFNINRQLDIIHNRNLIFNLIYFGTIFFLDYYILIHD